jgi:glucosamine--fructose-6-phosphate aminotransferase (isomerizing)
MNISETISKPFDRSRSQLAEQAGTQELPANICLSNLARIPVEVDYASEFRYRDPVLDESDLIIVISQSGETADTIAAMREAKLSGCKVLAICNVQGSMITREADGTILTHAGPEIGVASTKAFTSQMIALYLFALFLGQVRGTMGETEAKFHAQELAELPLKIEHLLNDADSIEELSKEFFRVQDFLYLGRGINFPIALEGALKLKEISYIHAEGYPAGEMKHGPNALIDEKLPVVIINTREEGNAGSELRYEKTHSNIVEVKSRDGIIISVLTEGDTMSSKVSSHVIEIPDRPAICLARSCRSCRFNFSVITSRSVGAVDVDQPRNLAKSEPGPCAIRLKAFPEAADGGICAACASPVAGSGIFLSELFVYLLKIGDGRKTAARSAANHQRHRLEAWLCPPDLKRKSTLSSDRGSGTARL